MKFFKFVSRVVLLISVLSHQVNAEEVISSTEPVKLAIWTEPFMSGVMDEWIADFEEEYPWIIIEHEGIDNEVWEETLRTAMFGGNPPDIFVIQSRAELLDYANSELIYDLTDWYSEHSERFISGYELTSVTKGRRYSIPWDVLVLDLIWYNPQIMTRYDLDPTTIKTWDDLMAMCEILKQHGEIPFAFGGGGAGWTGGHWVMFLLQKNLLPEDIIKLARGEKKWTDPDVVAALSYLEECVKKGYFAPGASEHDRNAGRALYFQGKGAFWQAGSWHLFQKSGKLAPSGWEFKFIPFPNFPDAPVQNVAISASNWTWSISNTSKHINEALLFLEYITRLKPAVELWVKESRGLLAVRGAVNENTADPEMVAIAQYLESAKVVPGLEHYFHRQVVQDGHWKGSTGILSGQISTKEWAELIEELHKASGVLVLE
jgi:raffinose/stachyose/melibiose transport system substrate-binding protein